MPDKHYMVDIAGKLSEIIKLIEEEAYFTINRSRQYGKTTTLAALFRKLKDEYIVLRLSFEGAGSGAFQSDEKFVMYFIRSVAKAMKYTSQSIEIMEQWENKEDYRREDYADAFEYLSDKITWLCENSEKEILLFADEVDKTSDNQIFLNFLGMLRNKYLSRQEGMDATFKNVILAGVYDIKNLKLKLRPEAERKYNSPWNVAVDFEVDMSFHPEEIATMLKEYEEEHHTGMDIAAVSEELYHYTNGYPYLVSWICKWIDEKGGKDWSEEGIVKAVKHYHHAGSTLKDDLIKNYENHPSLKNMIDDMLFSGKEYAYVDTDEAVDLGLTFGIFRKQTDMNGRLEIDNIIFSNILTEHVLIKKDREDNLPQPEKSQFIKDGRLDMPRVLTKFQEIMRAEYRTEDGKFLEQQGRLLFLCFLKPIINGTGFYYVEPETRNSTRMDIVVTYGDEEHIIELKLWHGDQYRADGIKQLAGYLDSRGQKKGYLLSFSFLKDKEYTAGYLNDLTDKEIPGIGDRKIYEVVV